MVHRVTSEQAGRRLDMLLAELTGVSRSRAQSLIEGGQALLNGGVPPKNGISLSEDDEIIVSLPQPRPVAAAAQHIALDIIYEDSSIIVVNKARGMVVHPAAGHLDGTLVNALLAHCGDLSGIGGELRPGIVHRLDKDTTGLLVAAKNDSAHISLSGQLKSRSASRMYAALAYGSPKQDSFTVDRPIGRHPSDRKKMGITEKGRSAKTEAQVWERMKGCTLLGLKLQTGRTHQIRVHLQSIGHPVMGDPVYGHTAAQKHAPQLMLHAFRLGFIHPETGRAVRFFAPPPEEFVATLRTFGWSGKDYWEEE